MALLINWSTKILIAGERSPGKKGLIAGVSSTIIALILTGAQGLIQTEPSAFWVLWINLTFG